MEKSEGTDETSVCTKTLSFAHKWRDSGHDPETRFSLFKHLSHNKTVCVSVCVQDLGVTASVVKPKRGLHGLRIGAGFIQRLCIVDLVVLHLWVQLAELLVALGSAAEVLDVVVAEAEQGERRPRLRGRRQFGCKQFELMLISSVFEGHFRKYGNDINNRKVDVIKTEIIIRCSAFNLLK